RLDDRVHDSLFVKAARPSLRRRLEAATQGVGSGGRGVYEWAFACKANFGSAFATLPRMSRHFGVLAVCFLAFGCSYADPGVEGLTRGQFKSDGGAEGSVGVDSGG